MAVKSGSCQLQETGSQTGERPAQTPRVLVARAPRRGSPCRSRRRCRSRQPGIAHPARLAGPARRAGRGAAALDATVEHAGEAGVARVRREAGAVQVARVVRADPVDAGQQLEAGVVVEAAPVLGPRRDRLARGRGALQPCVAADRCACTRPPSGRGGLRARALDAAQRVVRSGARCRSRGRPAPPARRQKPVKQTSRAVARGTSAVGDVRHGSIAAPAATQMVPSQPRSSPGAGAPVEALARRPCHPSGRAACRVSS